MREELVQAVWRDLINSNGGEEDYPRYVFISYEELHAAMSHAHDDAFRKDWEPIPQSPLI